MAFIDTLPSPGNNESIEIRHIRQFTHQVKHEPLNLLLDQQRDEALRDSLFELNILRGRILFSDNEQLIEDSQAEASEVIDRIEAIDEDSNAEVYIDENAHEIMGLLLQQNIQRLDQRIETREKFVYAAEQQLKKEMGFPKQIDFVFENLFRAPVLDISKNAEASVMEAFMDYFINLGEVERSDFVRSFQAHVLENENLKRLFLINVDPLSQEALDAYEETLETASQQFIKFLESLGPNHSAFKTKLKEVLDAALEKYLLENAGDPLDKGIIQDSPLYRFLLQ